MRITCAPAVEPAFSRLDKRWGLDASGYSPELKRDMVWLSGLLPYAQAEAVMQRIGQRAISDSSLWRAVERQGHRLNGAVEATCPGTPPLPSRAPFWNWGQMLSMDGGMVNIRQEGWKELKVGLIGEVVSAYHLLHDGTQYIELGADYFDKPNQDQLERASSNAYNS